MTVEQIARYRMRVRRRIEAQALYESQRLDNHDPFRAIPIYLVLLQQQALALRTPMPEKEFKAHLCTLWTIRRVLDHLTRRMDLACDNWTEFARISTPQPQPTDEPEA